MYGERFDEAVCLLDTIDPASYAVETNTGWLDVTPYERIAVIVDAGALGTAETLDVDIEIATSAAGANIHTLKSMTQLDEADEGSNKKVLINIRAEELSKPTGALSTEYTHLQVETTPSGASIYGVIVLGYLPDRKPVTNNWDEVVA